ncbi:MAG: site-specific DNA-methyltransferase [Candidatus Helarchaeota archaeon]|nr:site-specific DNA-methyltransferase [Candidatus Helarchaeota archaeon]
MEIYETMQILDITKLNSVLQDSFDVIIFNTFFTLEEKYSYQIPSNEDVSNFIEAKTQYLDNFFRILKNSGLLFIYGLPKWLPYIGNYLDSLKNDHSLMIFKYWIALALDKNEARRTLCPEHIGLLLYLKSRNRKSPSPFHLNTKKVRIPYKNCEVCGKNIKDWGGKKHLINPLGANVSDVWRDVSRLTLNDNIIPEFILKRIYDLTEKKSFSIGYSKELSKRPLNAQDSGSSSRENPTVSTVNKPLEFKFNRVIHTDSLKYMEEISKRYPEGIFDLAFADPPYNLAKTYSNYMDIQDARDYINWCDKWLGLMAKVIRPGGVLMVLNLPKWCIYHATFLNNILNFRHWIVWDALSSPAGKIMPAHYAILYYTKPGGKITFNYPSDIEADSYCLRISCRKERKKIKNIKKVKVTDIWWDIHRIKHKRDRDEHPCQLPLNLMKRIIEMVTNPNDLVYDPFCGAGTTAVCAKMLKRNFITTEIDENYVKIAKDNLRRLQPTLQNDYVFIRAPVKEKKISIGVPKKEIEIKFIELCKSQKKVLTLEEVKTVNETLFKNISNYYPNFKTLKKIARRRLEMSD